MDALRDAILNLTGVLQAVETDYWERLAALPPIEPDLEAVLLDYLASEDEQAAHESPPHPHMSCRDEVGVACVPCAEWAAICDRHYTVRHRLLGVCRAIKAKREAR